MQPKHQQTKYGSRFNNLAIASKYIKEDTNADKLLKFRHAERVLPFFVPDYTLSTNVEKYGTFTHRDGTIAPSQNYLQRLQHETMDRQDTFRRAIPGIYADPIESSRVTNGKYYFSTIKRRERGMNPEAMWARGPDVQRVYM
jgi:hypothetical protein